MVRANPGQTGFNAGEFSPRMTSRVDFQKYALAAETVENILPLPQGGMARRPGTRFIKEVKTSANLTHLIPFVYSTEQAYMIEAGANYFRFYKDQASIAVNNVIAAITNGTFDTDLNGWADLSTGTATISHLLTTTTTEGTFGASASSPFRFGDAVSNGLNFGFKFTNTTAGDVTEVKANVQTFTTSFNSVVRIYSDTPGQPNAQVGGDSATVSLSATGDVSYTWTTSPTLSAATVYWVIFVDTSGGGTGDVRLSVAADQGSSFETGRHDTITSIDDGTVGLPSGDLRVEITVTQPSGTGDALMALNGATGETAVGEQTVSIGGAIEGTFPNAQASTVQFGDGVAGAKHLALKFTNTTAGTVANVKIEVATVSTSFDVLAEIYTDNSGSPNAKLESSSKATLLDAAGEFTIAWTDLFDGAPTLSAATVYWLVLIDADAGSGEVTLSYAADQGSSFATGRNDTITSITDDGAGDLRVEINVGNSTTNLTTKHVLAFEIVGVQNDEVKLRIGTTSGGIDVVNDRIVIPGWHRVEFTPNVSPVYIQFRNELVKTISVDDVSILDNVPIEIETPYASTDLVKLKWAQSADVLFVFHPSYQPYKLERRSDNDWAFIKVPWLDGPYLDENLTDTTFAVDVAAAGKGRTLTASDTVGVNNERGFLSTDVGRLVRLKTDTSGAGQKTGWGIITAVATTTSATIDIIRDAEDTGGHLEWSLGAWSDTTGWPSSCAFFEQRFIAAGTTEQPQTFWMSQSGDLENMQPDSVVADVLVIEDDDAIVFTIAAEKVNAIRWISPGDILVLGTTGGEWSAKSGGPVISPLDIEVRRESSYGSANFSPVRAGNAILFIQEAQREIREFVFSFDVDGYVVPDLTILSQHVTLSGINKIIYAQQPDSIVWCLRNDGILAALTYKRENNVAGWSRHIIGGEFISATGNAVVESIATIPGDNGSGQVEDSTNRDEVWLIVKRTINGATKRYIEMFEQLFEGPVREDYTTDALWNAAVLKEQKESYYVDSLLTLDVPVEITNIVIS